jgi:hypothetical protein
MQVACGGMNSVVLTEGCKMFILLLLYDLNLSLRAPVSLLQVVCGGMNCVVLAFSLLRAAC